MRKTQWASYDLNFITPGGTSRGVLKKKQTYFVMLEEDGVRGIGECALFRGLSIDDLPDYEEILLHALSDWEKGMSGPELLESYKKYPSIVFGFETAFAQLASKGCFQIFDSKFAQGNSGIWINGLIWMGQFDFMLEQLEDKLNQGFSCVKLKIGAIDFTKELELLARIRDQFPAEKVEIRVDANGAFLPEDALEKLRELNKFQIHSIEQPIRQGQWSEMSKLCAQTPFPIALDEELIGVFHQSQKEELLDEINPQYIILKPALVGGFNSCNEWIEAAEARNIGWWITSALESNVGLSAIAQFTASLQPEMPQGLGTGKLFSNNFPSPLRIVEDKLWYEKETPWQMNLFDHD